MEFYDAVAARRTIRDFTGAPVEMEAVKRIAAAGLKAPTNDHLRDWEIAVIIDKERIASILSPIPQKYDKRALQSWKFSDDAQEEMYYDAVAQTIRNAHKVRLLDSAIL